jgi:uncharacterized protein (DUF427 family)
MRTAALELGIVVDPDDHPTSGGRVRVAPCPKRIRAYRAGTLILDTTNAMYVWEHPAFPAYFVPTAEVLVPTPGSVTIDELPNHVHFPWRTFDAWFEEDEEVFVHPRDPNTRVDILPSSRRVVVEIDGVVVADSTHARVLFETRLPPRWYIPKTDVRMDLLTPTNTVSLCPYKGQAEYWTAHVGDRDAVDIAWSYPTPLPESERIAGLVSFYNEKVDLIVDGERLERARTKFS